MPKKIKAAFYYIWGQLSKKSKQMSLNKEKDVRIRSLLNRLFLRIQPEDLWPMSLFVWSLRQILTH